MSTLFRKWGKDGYSIPDPARKVQSVLGVHPYGEAGEYTDCEQAPAGEPDDDDLRARIIAALCQEIEALEKVTRSAHRWWRSLRPCGWNYVEHSNHPRVNAKNDREKDLSFAVCRLEKRRIDRAKLSRSRQQEER